MTLAPPPEAGLTLFRQGKVRDTYDLGDGTLLMVASDRVSVYDVILPTVVPGKGVVLTQMARWWFDRIGSIVPHHLLDDGRETLPAAALRPDWQGRTMRVRQARRIDIECVVRGYLAGSGWQEYHAAGTLAGEPLPPGMGESARLPHPRFTPATKSDTGHDQNISRSQVARILGASLALRLEEASLALYGFAARHCAEQDMILADTKFEFGMVGNRLVLIDELCTPDSSRFWDAGTWREGEPQPPFDKQFVRDYAAAQEWDKMPPGPLLPDDIVRQTRQRYFEAARRVCGLNLEFA